MSVTENKTICGSVPRDYTCFNCKKTGAHYTADCNEEFEPLKKNVSILTSRGVKVQEIMKRKLDHIFYICKDPITLENTLVDIEKLLDDLLGLKENNHICFDNICKN